MSEQGEKDEEVVIREGDVTQADRLDEGAVEETEKDEELA